MAGQIKWRKVCWLGLADRVNSVTQLEELAGAGRVGGADTRAKAGTLAR